MAEDEIIPFLLEAFKKADKDEGAIAQKHMVWDDEREESLPALLFDGYFDVASLVASFQENFCLSSRCKALEDALREIEALPDGSEDDCVVSMLHHVKPIVRRALIGGE